LSKLKKENIVALTHMLVRGEIFHTLRT